MRILTSSEKNSAIEQQAAAVEHSSSLLSRIRLWVAQLCQQLLWDRQTCRIQVWHCCNRDGRLWWNADDLETGRSLRQVDEAQLRIWLEHRYR